MEPSPQFCWFLQWSELKWSEVKWSYGTFIKSIWGHLPMFVTHLKKYLHSHARFVFNWYGHCLLIFTVQQDCKDKTNHPMDHQSIPRAHSIAIGYMGASHFWLSIIMINNNPSFTWELYFLVLASCTYGLHIPSIFGFILNAFSAKEVSGSLSPHKKGAAGGKHISINF